jgi:hypothetical protein
MSGKKAIQFASALALMTAGAGAAALPFSSFDARSYAMGGAGVASGTHANAVFLNPALLALEGKAENYSMELPVIGGRTSDPGNLADAIDEFNEVEPVGVFQDAVNAYIATPNAGTAATVQSAGDQLIEQLESISGDILSADADVAVVVGVPHRKYAMSAFVDVHVIGGAVGEATEEDIAAIQQTIDDALNAQAITDPTDTFTSSASARFSRITEVGVSIAQNFDALGGIAVGITPKLVGVRTNDFLFVGSEIDTAEVSMSDTQESDFGVNLDVGLAKAWGDSWRAGFTVKNLLAQEYETVLGNELKIEPMARIGVAYRNSCLTLASDLDLTENESTGYDPRTRYASLGAELYLFELFRVRLGYRHNLSDVPAGSETDLMMAGLGFSSFGANVDVAAAGNGDEFGAALQLGFRFD